MFDRRTGSRSAWKPNDAQYALERAHEARHAREALERFYLAERLALLRV